MLKTIKLPNETTGEYLCNLQVDTDYLDRNENALIMHEGKIWHIRLSKFWKKILWKDIIKKKTKLDSD